ncbi:hypothetical protein QW131_15415 [Roseibium salinum]|nr:hypothetical protein [Roseibium salinum]
MRAYGRRILDRQFFPAPTAGPSATTPNSFQKTFRPKKLEEAARRGLLEWEKIGKDGARGELAKFNASAWTFNMKNRAGWRDRSEVEAWGILGGPDEAQKNWRNSSRAARRKSLWGVMALLTAKDTRKDGDGPRNAD